MNLRERLADPHGHDKPLFPVAIAGMSQDEKWEEVRECARAFRINVWQSTAQMEETQSRHIALWNSIHENILQTQQSKEQA